MPLSELPAGQSIEKSYLPFPHGVRFGKPARSIMKIQHIRLWRQNINIMCA